MAQPKKVIEWSQAQEIVRQSKEKQKAQDAAFKKRVDEAGEDVLERIYNCEEHFTYDDIEDIMHGHGLEMDYIMDILM